MRGGALTADTIERCTKADFDQVVAEHGAFWDSDLTLPLHHPIFIFEFGDSAFVIRDGEKVTAYLQGFRSQVERVGYVHMVAVRSGYRRLGLARRLYEHFVDQCKRHRCTGIKATASPKNEASIRFHTAFGMTMIGDGEVDGVPVVRGYLKPGIDRVVFRMAIDCGTGFQPVNR